MTTTIELTEEGTSRHATVAGVRLHYHEAGNGPVVLMLHGGGPGTFAWASFERNIATFAAKFRVLLLDLPGFGWSDPVVLTDDRPVANAGYVDGFLGVLGIDHAHVIGNSMGGASAIELAIRHAGRVDRLVLIGSGGAGPSLFVPVPTEGDKILGRNFADPSSENMRRLVEMMVFDQSLVDEDMIARRVERASDPALRDARRRSARKQGEPLADLSQVKAKTLIVWGREDRFNPYDTGLRFVQGIADSELHIFSRCGHWAHVEHADAFNRLVIDFLSR